jgi:hypothetical protein
LGGKPGDLATGVHTRIGTTGGANCYLGIGYGSQRTL